MRESTVRTSTVGKQNAFEFLYTTTRFFTKSQLTRNRRRLEYESDDTQPLKGRTMKIATASLPNGGVMLSRRQKHRTPTAMAKKKPQRTTLPEGLRQAIRNSGKTSYQLNEETGVNHGVILRFMKSERDIRMETAEKLAAAVGLTVNVPIERTES